MKRRTKLIIISSIFLLLLLLSGYLIMGPPQILASTETSEFCVSCHVMQEQYDAWLLSGLHNTIRCVDCHLPNDHPLNHYFWKGIDGAKDFLSFHSGLIPQPIVAREHTKNVVQENCVRCHARTVSLMETDDRYCWSCHRATTHRLTGVVIE